MGQNDPKAFNIKKKWNVFFFIHFKNIYIGFVICIHFFTKKQTNKDTISTLNIIHHQLGHWLSLIEKKKKIQQHCIYIFCH